MTSFRSTLCATVAFTISSLSSYAQQIGSGVIPTGIPDTGAQLDVIVEGRVSIDNSGLGVNKAPSFPTQRNENANTVSVTTLQAPQSAIRAYEDAEEAFSKLQLAVAERELTKATTAYPEFADAWTLLGRVHEKLAEPDQAKKTTSRLCLRIRDWPNLIAN